MSTATVPGAHDAEPGGILARSFPPVAQVATVSLALVVIGGIFMATYAPRRPPLALPSALLALSLVGFVTAVGLLVRLEDFAWDRFFLVAKWAVLAYVISAGMIEFAFVHDHTRGAPLAVVTGLIVVFALDVPLINAFTVARYSSPPATTS